MRLSGQKTPSATLFPAARALYAIDFFQNKFDKYGSYSVQRRIVQSLCDGAAYKLALFFRWDQYAYQYFSVEEYRTHMRMVARQPWLIVFRQRELTWRRGHSLPLFKHRFRTHLREKSETLP